MIGCVDVSQTCGPVVLLSDGGLRYDPAIRLNDSAGGWVDVIGFSDRHSSFHRSSKLFIAKADSQIDSEFVLLATRICPSSHSLFDMIAPPPLEPMLYSGAFLDAPEQMCVFPSNAMRPQCSGPDHLAVLQCLTGEFCKEIHNFYRFIKEARPSLAILSIDNRRGLKISQHSGVPQFQPHRSLLWAALQRPGPATTTSPLALSSQRLVCICLRQYLVWPRAPIC